MNCFLSCYIKSSSIFIHWDDESSVSMVGPVIAVLGKRITRITTNPDPEYIEIYTDAQNIIFGKGEVLVITEFKDSSIDLEVLERVQFDSKYSI